MQIVEIGARRVCAAAPPLHRRDETSGRERACDRGILVMLVGRIEEGGAKRRNHVIVFDIDAPQCFDVTDVGAAEGIKGVGHEAWLRWATYKLLPQGL